MKKILFAGVSALALFAGAAFAQSSNDSTIDQVGTSNNVTVDQTESVPHARLVNRSVVDQGLANLASSHNTADIKQKDSGTLPIRAVTNDSTVIQNGTWNDATVKQTGDVDDNAPLKPALNTVNITQTGNGTKKKERNIAFVSQNSDDGPVGNNSTTSASITQNGRQNESTIRQAGEKDTVSAANVGQVGNGNTADISQSENNANDFPNPAKRRIGTTSNFGSITQTGNDNTATIVQGGSENPAHSLQTNNATVEQTGNEHVATVTQEGNGGLNSSFIEQSVADNTATVYQTTSAAGSHTNSSTAIQSGMGNVANIRQR